MRGSFRMTFRLGLLFSLWFLTGTLQARLGETLAQCEERYGPATSPENMEWPTSTHPRPGNFYVFKPDGWEIWVCFVDGISIFQYYQKPLLKEFRGLICQDEEEAIKAAESCGQKWKESGRAEGRYTDSKTGFEVKIITNFWVTPNGFCMSSDSQRQFVLVYSNRWPLACKVVQMKAKEKRLEKVKQF